MKSDLRSGNQQNRHVMKNAYAAGEALNALVQHGITILSVQFGDTAQPQIEIEAHRDNLDTFEQFPRSETRIAGVIQHRVSFRGCLLTWSEALIPTFH